MWNDLWGAWGADDEESQSQTHWIPERNLPDLQHRLDKLARKAERLGVGAITYEVGEPENRPFVYVKSEARFVPADEVIRPVDPSEYRYFRFFPVIVTGTTPRLAGWTFVATLQHLKDDTGTTINLLRVVPEFTGVLPEEFRHRDASNCDHCCRTIPWRKDTYVVQNEETGEFKQVGRHCTQDFLGGKNPQAVASYLETLFSALSIGTELESYGGGWGRGEIRYPMSAFLTQTAATIRVRGWMSRGKAREQEYGPAATADIVLKVLGPPPFDQYGRREWEELREELRPNEEDAELAEKALEYAREVLSNKEDRDDYEHNLYVATTQPTLGYRLAGITASLVPYYLRNVARMAERERRKDSEWFGEVGKRADFYVTPLKVIPIDSLYGITYLHRFITRDGDIATWFASSNPEVDIGKEYRVKATVKKHDDYKGIKQTVLTRVKVYTDEERQVAEEKEAQKIEREAKRAAKAMAKAAKEAAKAAKAAAKAAGSDLGGLPPEAVEHYLGEDPDIFALALYEELGLQPVAVCGYVQTDSGYRERVVAHIAAALPDGNLVDAAGVSHPEELLDAVERYFFLDQDLASLCVEPIPVEETAGLFGPPPGDDELDEAREYARRVFEMP